MAKPDVRLALTWAFDTFRRNAVPFLALAAVVMVIQFIDQVAVRVLDEAGVSPFVVFGVTLAFILLATVASIGVYRAAIRTTQGHEPSFADMLTTQYLGLYALFVLAYVVLTFFGLLLCIFPGLLVIFFLQLSPYYILDRGAGVGAAIRASIDAIRPNVVPALLMALLNVLVNISGTLLFGILTLITLPFAALFTAHMYRQFNHEPIA